MNEQTASAETIDANTLTILWTIPGDYHNITSLASKRKVHMAL